ncbi:MAG: class I SAM-dependent methyltransferase [Deltaproteobacteria bacterium]|nr:class I SAM-dependent methyltransferase [Deltaproteobacteria bacterium]
MPRNQAGSAYSAQVAEHYDRHVSASDKLPPYFRHCVDYQVPRALVGQPLNALELGCGNGRLSILLARHYGFRMTAVDVSPRAVELARVNAARHRAVVRFVNADILGEATLPEQYDLIIGHFILHEVVGDDFERLARFLVAHLAPQGYCSFLENSYFNPVFRWIREALPPDRRVSHPFEYPFDPQRYAALKRHFAFVRRDVPIVNLAERFYRQFWPCWGRSPWFYKGAVGLDTLLTFALPPRARRWVSYFQLISFSQVALEPRLGLK